MKFVHGASLTARVRFFARLIFRAAVGKVRALDNRCVGITAIRMSSAYQRRSGQVLPHHARHVVASALPYDPLGAEGPLPAIEVVIPLHPKDMDTLDLVLEGIRVGIRNPIRAISLVSPGKNVRELRARYPECETLHERDIIESELWDAVSDRVPAWRRGWVVQQVIKFRYSMLCNEMGCLVMDADTVLLKPRTWINSESRQLLCLADEYHLPYILHAQRVWTGLSEFIPFTYVTHHQLMQPTVVREMFDEVGGLVHWLKMADWVDQAPLSEYHSYGVWLASHRNDLVEFAQWSNVSCSVRSLTTRFPTGPLRVGHLQAEFSSALSVSLHTYLA